MGDTSKPSDAYLGLEVVQTHLRAAAEMVGREKARDFHDEMTYRLSAGWDIHDDVTGNTLVFDSPLEAIFWLWWHAMVRIDGVLQDELVLQPHKVERIDEHAYALDFVVWSVRARANWPLIAIELDGHTFHEKTLEQVTYRNQRDRALQQRGWRVFHFSWNEFTAQPEASVNEVLDFIKAALRASYAPSPAGPT